MTSVYPPMTYKDFQSLKTQIRSKAECLDPKKDQFLRVKLVNKAEFEKIEARREEIGGAARLQYFPDIETLIIKIVSRPHEKAHRDMARIFDVQTHLMGVGLQEFSAVGATLYKGPTGSGKECDSSWINSWLRPGGFPCLVIEVGVSESLEQLHRDAAWWVANSAGQVNLIILISVAVQTKQIQIEKYVPFLATTPATRRTVARSTWKPKKVSPTVRINQAVMPPTIQGAPLVLSFKDVIGRPPIPPHERDISLSADTLLDWAMEVFM